MDAARVLYLETWQDKGTEIVSTVADVSPCHALFPLMLFSTVVGGQLGWD